jgi:hypothetical protein
MTDKKLIILFQKELKYGEKLKIGKVRYTLKGKRLLVTI